MNDNLIICADGGQVAPRLRGKEVGVVASCTLGLSEALTPITTFTPTHHDAWPPMVFPRPTFEEDDMLTADHGLAEPLNAPTYAQLSFGRGLVIAIGGTSSFHDEFVTTDPEQSPVEQRAFIDHVLLRLLHSGFDDELGRRLKEPQRHRLLQGYPMPKLMLPESKPLSADLCPTPPPRPVRRGPAGYALPRPGE